MKVVSDKTLLGRWPDDLVERVSSKNFVLVVGAGVSRQCTNAAGASPPSWDELLRDLIDHFAAGAVRNSALKLVNQERYLDAAELLRSRARTQAKEQDFLNRIAAVTDGGTKPAEHYQPSQLHQTLLALEPDVILTTNYDRILERATRNGYNVHSYDSTTLGHDVRSGWPVLVKVHGGVDSPTKIVLTRSDYTRLRRDGARALEVLQALFLTRTALFVGYGFSDPDIHLLLENVLGGRGEVPAHYLLTGVIPTYQRDSYHFSYGTAAVTYRQGDYAEMQRMLELFNSRVLGQRYKQGLVS
jgi:hypothetical protein